ncbi:geranylgeranyl reductase family protein [Fervidicoccus fontis]|uniref:Geranylgeranyl reductase family protein n=1 Tax=Fervidicoccus fontis TaxID=683846 RepID=A0A843A5J1_9CREN|nr:digeranylgeranylglycerophospholipid reductase [Fervidicoccus fontis]MBE9390548.1 geranylgeranyl reductase family protein [Fervidicoccus fontis]
MIDNNDYDVIIAGSGPSGSTLAYFLSQKKSYKVAVFDSRSWEDLWGKPCGNAIGKHHFFELGIPEPQGDEIKQTVTGISIISPSEHVEFRIYGEGYIIDRKKFGTRLLKTAVDNGVEFYPRTQVLGPVFENAKLAGIKVKINDKIEEFKGKIIVDATGTAGVIRRYLPKEWPVSEELDPKDSDIAYREIVKLNYEIKEPSILKIYLNQKVSPGGYWWYFPEGIDSANIGLGVQGGMGYPNPKLIYENLLSKRPEIRSKKEVISSGGAQVPTRRPLDSLVWDNFIAIGDSAFAVNPVHGGGMGYAMISAYWASKGIENAFEKGEPNRFNLWITNVGYMKMIGTKQASLELTRMFLQRLSDEELDFIMEKKIVDENDVDILGRKGELNESAIEKSVKIVSDFFKILKMTSKPSLLLKLRTLSTFMNKMKNAYNEYPETPYGLSRWKENVAEILKNFKAEIKA